MVVFGMTHEIAKEMKRGRPRSPQIAAAFEEMRVHGIPYDAFLAYQAQYHNCKRRGIELRFSLREWWAWWASGDKWEARRARKLLMLRIADKGHYEPGNVYAGSAADNGRDMWSRPSSAQVAASKAAGERGADILRSHMSKPVIGPDGRRWPSLSAAANGTGVHYETISRRARRQSHGWRFE